MSEAHDDELAEKCWDALMEAHNRLVEVNFEEFKAIFDVVLPVIYDDIFGPVEGNA